MIILATSRIPRGTISLILYAAYSSILRLIFRCSRVLFSSFFRVLTSFYLMEQRFFFHFIFEIKLESPFCNFILFLFKLFNEKLKNYQMSAAFTNIILLRLELFYFLRNIKSLSSTCNEQTWTLEYDSVILGDVSKSLIYIIS